MSTYWWPRRFSLAGIKKAETDRPLCSLSFFLANDVHDDYVDEYERESHAPNEPDIIHTGHLPFMVEVMVLIFEDTRADEPADDQ